MEKTRVIALLYRLAGALWGRAGELKEAGEKDELKKYAEEAVKILNNTKETVIAKLEKDAKKET